MNKSEVKFIFRYFLVWRLVLFLIVFLAIKLIPLNSDFLGGGMKNYISNPFFWGFVNFDGEHYLSIARNGYEPLNYFFFPLYPLVVSRITTLFGRSIELYAFVGQVISNFLMIIGFIGLYKLIKLDYKKRLARNVILLLMLFPTSFYFVSFYTESLFFVLIVWSFYFVRMNKWGYSSIVAALSSAARLVGVSLSLAFMFEALVEYRKNKTINWKYIAISFSAPMGLLVYIFYLYQTTGDPLKFMHGIELFGEQRSSSFVILPQVFYRYLFKIIPNLSFSYAPSVLTIPFEFAIGILFLLLSIISFIKLRPSYAIFLFVGYLIPTLSGSFSSLPRYVLVLFPAFILMSIWVLKQTLIVQRLVYGLLFLGLVVFFSMFIRGYWVA